MHSSFDILGAQWCLLVQGESGVAEQIESSIELISASRIDGGDLKRLSPFSGANQAHLSALLIQCRPSLEVLYSA